MKKLLLILPLLIVLTHAKAQQSDTIRYKAIQTYMLAGPVKSVTNCSVSFPNSPQTYTEFDRDGEIVAIKYNNKLQRELYENYTVSSNKPYTREDQSGHSDVTQRFRNYWIFDKKNRPVRHDLTYSTISYSIQWYVYENEDTRFPKRIITILYEDYGESIAIDDYTYLEFDTIGNWTKRQVDTSIYIDVNHYDEQTGPEIQQEYQKGYIETATYTYWD